MYPMWTPPIQRRKHKKTPLPLMVIHDQLFSHTLHSYDFDRKTWYPNIVIETSTGVPPPPIDPMIKKKFAEYEEVQFNLLKDRYIAQKEYEAMSGASTCGREGLVEKVKETLTSLDKKIAEHAKVNANLLDIINIHIIMEKDYVYSIDRLTRKDYLIVNKTLPFDVPVSTVKPRVYKLPTHDDFVASPDMNSRTLFPSLG